MLDRADSPLNLGPLIASGGASATPFPLWALAGKPPESQAEAAFLAGAALARLDLIVRENSPWAGAFRRRLALRAAVACVARSGRAEDEAALRDAVQFTPPGADPGPAGRQLIAWRALTARSTAHWRLAIGVAAEALAAPHDEALHAAVEAAKTTAADAQPAPFAAAKAFALARRALSPEAGPKLGRRGGEGELLAAALADSVLAQKLNWPFAVPLLAASLFTGSARPTVGTASEGGETTRLLSAYATAAAHACDLAAELGRRARGLQAVAPKLRAKGAAAALQAFLDEDSLSAATRIKGLSERGARRLFERLVSLGAIRELTGRATFRLYGL